MIKDTDNTYSNLLTTYVLLSPLPVHVDHSCIWLVTFLLKIVHQKIPPALFVCFLNSFSFVHHKEQGGMANSTVLPCKAVHLHHHDQLPLHNVLNQMEYHNEQSVGCWHIQPYFKSTCCNNNTAVSILFQERWEHFCLICTGALLGYMETTVASELAAVVFPVS